MNECDKSRFDPDVIEFCVNCTAADCKYGKCDAFVDFYRARQGLPPIDRTQEPKEKKHKAYTRFSRLEAFGECHTLTTWAEKLGIDSATLYMRLYKGWDVERALSTPCRQKLITIDGETHTLVEWSRISGRARTTIQDRLRRGADYRTAIFANRIDNRRRSGEQNEVQAQHAVGAGDAPDGRARAGKGKAAAGN